MDIRAPFDPHAPAWLPSLIEAIDAAMPSHSTPAVTARIERALTGNFLAGTLAETLAETPLPRDWLVYDPWQPFRQELYRSRRHDYQIVVTTWAPGQSAQVHDLSNTWSVQATLAGSVEVTGFVVARQRGKRVVMQTRDRHVWRHREVGILLPPLDIHECRNPSAVETAVSLHVYGRPLKRVNLYVPTSKNAYQQTRGELRVA